MQTGSSSPAALRWRIVDRRAKQQLSAIHKLPGSGVWIAGRDAKSGLVERWDGRRLRRLPAAPGATGFSDIASVSARDVWAVGESADYEPLIEHWDGAVWQSVEFGAPPVPPCADPSSCFVERPHLDRLAAVGSRDVWALGSIRACDNSDCYAELFAEHWNGATWETVPVLQPVSEPVITDMQALGRDDVWAVGYDHKGPGTQFEIVLHWDGRRWLEVRSAFDYADCAETGLSSVAAVTPTDVWGAGTSDRCGWLVERWKGKRFSLVRAPKSVPGQASTPPRRPTSGSSAAGRLHDGTVPPGPLCRQSDWGGTTA